MGLQEIRWGVRGLIWLRVRKVAGYCEQGNKFSGS